jgi:integrase
MATVKLRYVYPDKDRRGRRRWLLRMPGRKAVTLKGVYGSPEFMIGYQAAIEGAEPAPRKGVGAPRERSLAALALSYFNSATFKGHRPETQRSQRGIINALVERHGDKPWSGDYRIRQEHVQAMIDAKAETPSAARNLLFALRALGAHAIALKWRADNPALGVTRPKIKTPGFATWTEAHIELYRAHWKLGTMERLAIEIGLNHGPRRGDAVCHGPRQEIDGGLAYRQSKTGTEMFNTIWPPLRAAIEAMPVRGLDTYLVTGFGKPFTAAGFGNWFRDACDAVSGLPKGLSFHGLRKALLCRIAATGRGSKQTMSVSGHKSLKMVERYTEAANNRRLQLDTMRDVQAMFEERSRTSDLHTPGQVSHTDPQVIGKKGS